MEQATIDRIRQYAGFFNDLRGIANNNHYQLTQDRIKALEAEFEALNGIVEDIKADPDREGAKVMLKGWAGLSWPVMLALPAKEEEQYKWGLAVNFPSKPQQEIEEILGALKGLMARCNMLTARIAGAVGLMAPIDPVEAGKFFKREFVKGQRWGRYLARLQAFADSNPSKLDIALVGYYIKGTKWAMAGKAKIVAKWMRDFYSLFGIEGDCPYKPGKLATYLDEHKERYNKLITPFRKLLE